ncbi:MAG: hypothetical protein WA151_18660 [Desulfatirhabdiaceae bacterium]
MSATSDDVAPDYQGITSQGAEGLEARIRAYVASEACRFTPSRDFRAHGSKHLCSAPAGSHQPVPAVFGPIECGLGAAYLIHDGSRIQKAVAPPDIPCVIDKAICRQMVMIDENFNLSEQKKSVVEHQRLN